MESNQLQFTEVRFWRSIFCFHSELKCCTFKSIYLIGNQRQKAQTSVICNNLSAQGETTTMMKMKNVQLINTEPSVAVTVGGDPAGCWAAFFCTGGCFCYLVFYTSITDGRQRDWALWMEEKKLPHTVHFRAAPRCDERSILSRFSVMEAVSVSAPDRSWARVWVALCSSPFMSELCEWTQILRLPTICQHALLARLQADERGRCKEQLTHFHIYSSTEGWNWASFTSWTVFLLVSLWTFTLN